MKAKFIYEVFREDSDPINDMGIGIYAHRTFDTTQELHKFMYDIIPALFNGKKTNRDY